MLFICVAKLLLCSSAIGGSDEAPNFGNPPIVRLLSDSVLDLGIVAQGSKSTAKFEFRNTTDSQLTYQIKSITCGCVKPTSNTGTIGPNDDATIEFRVDTTFFHLPTFENVGHVQFSSEKSVCDFDLTIKGEIKVWFSCSESMFKLKGRVGQLLISDEIIIRQESDVPLLIGDMVSTAQSLKVHDDFRVISGRAEYKVALQLSPYSTPGTYSENVRLYIADSPTFEYLDLPVEVVIDGLIEVKPPKAYFGRITRNDLEGKPITRRCSVKHIEGQPFVLTHSSYAEPNQAPYSVDLIPLVDRYDVVFTLKPQNIKNLSNIDEEAIFNVDGVEEQIRIPVFVQVRDRP